MNKEKFFAFGENPPLKYGVMTPKTRRLQARDGRGGLLTFPAYLRQRSLRHFAERFRSGDREAYEKIYRKFKKPILNYVSARSRDQHQAEELTQDIFLKAYRFRKSFDPRYAFSTWLWTIARNTLADSFRRKRVTLLEDNASGAMDPESYPSAAPDPEQACLEISDREGFVKLMSGLTGLQKKAIFMRVIHQLPYHEIAKRLDLSLSAVKCLVHRGRNSLTRKMLDGPPPSFAGSIVPL